MTYRDPIESPYDPRKVNYAPEAVELSDVIAEAMRATSVRLRVAMPCSIDSVVANQRVNLQPLIQARYLFQDEPVTLPIIRNCPVIMPHGANYSIRLPIAAGDTGLAIFSDRSLDAWLAAASPGASPIDPQDTRCHNLNDAIFLPGLVPFASQTQESGNDLTISNGAAQIRLQPGGTMKLGSTAPGGQELLSLMDTIISTLSTLAANIALITVSTPAGPSLVPNNAAAFVQAQATLAQLQASLDTLKAPPA
jgi:hypothetical protein